MTAAWVTLNHVDPPYRLTGLSLYHSQLQPLDSCVLFLNLFVLLFCFGFRVSYIIPDWPQSSEDDLVTGDALVRAHKNSQEHTITRGIS